MSVGFHLVALKIMAHPNAMATYTAPSSAKSMFLRSLLFMSIT
ncbi:MAG: hypothetical protein BWY85_00946 [Firmicutes bacterium ADurb.Bin506]|nr:MAG: hypothetical protein BWY85_00946 [Firmicutes bacterium ADurb.Bin506]